MAEAVTVKSSKDKSDEQGAKLPRERTSRTSAPGPEARILALQNTVGNRAVSRFLQSGAGPLKPADYAVSRPEDPTELEAERTAARVLDATNAGAAGGASVAERPAARQSHTAGGQPLPEPQRTFFESRFGQDLGDVRLHTDASAASAARALNARAFNVGGDIVFGQGQYAPETEGGRRVLAHELGHVAQQSQGRAPAGLIQRVPEPPRPKAPPSVTKQFTELPDHEVVKDPTGRTHGISILRRGDELFYFLPPPNKGSRRVPRPRKSGKSANERETIKSVTWGAGGMLQTAFEVDFGSLDSPPFTVNIFGMGRLQTLMGALFRQPAELETHAEGLEVERGPGVLAEDRPAKPARPGIATAERYHTQDATYSMYVFANRRVEVIEDATGKTLWGPLPKEDLRDLQISRKGDVVVSWFDPTKGAIFSVKFDLYSRTFSATGQGASTVSADRKASLASLSSMKVKVIERGSQFTDLELKAALDVLGRWQGSKGVVDSLKANGAPGLSLVKDVLIDGASYNSTTGQVSIPGGVELSPSEQQNVMIHELAHALFHAKGLMPSTKVKTPEHIQKVAAELHELSDLDLIDEGSIGSFRRKRRTKKEWELTLSTNEQLNLIWQDLHFRFPISDPEGTSDIRGLDVADESRYLGDPRGDVLGHGFDNVNEFVASFVGSSSRFQDEMTRTVEKSGDATLVDLYTRLWTLVNTEIVSLGPKNPYADIKIK